VDVGYGTVIEAWQFHEAGCPCWGSSPTPLMAEYARGGGIEVDVATFEAWDPAGRMFDAVIAWQALGRPVLGSAKAAYVPRPTGRIALFRHVFQPPHQVTAAFVAAYRRVVPDSSFDSPAMTRPAPDTYQRLFATAADGIREAGAFGDPKQLRFDWEQPYRRDEWLDLLPTQVP
jgi:hypothetical protein